MKSKMPVLKIHDNIALIFSPKGTEFFRRTNIEEMTPKIENILKQFENKFASRGHLQNKEFDSPSSPLK